ncbi:MAG TPA: RDD family protein [Tepidisphaeraceae bacterium]|jgi:uncharacterized RDD family membrane protein YckC|nr:RDD family protein [Tepidisphaeraceae bacterium]
MKHAVNKVMSLLMLLVLMLAAAPVQAVMTSPAVQDVAAEGAGDQLWIAEVLHADDSVPTSAERSRVYSMTMPSDGWQRPMLIGAGIKDLSHRGSQLVALLRTGEWVFAWPDGRSTGPALPDNAEIVSIGGDGSAIWAVGRVPGGMAGVTTRPATTEPDASETATTRATESVTTAPSTLAEPMRLVLFRLDRSSWIPEADLPSDIPESITRLSIETIRGSLYIAAIVGGQIEIYARDEDHWALAGKLKSPGLVRAKVLDGEDRPIVWAAGATGPGMFFIGSGSGAQQQWSKPAELRVKADMSQLLPRDATVVAHRVELVYAKADKLYVQSFDWRTGQVTGDPIVITPGMSGSTGADPKFGLWINIAIMTVLLMVMAGAMRRRGEIEETIQRVDRLPLAPLGMRLAAGLIDMWPQWTAATYLSLRPDAPTDFQTVFSDPIIMRLNMAAMVAYIIYTIVSEMLFGRTIGKVIFGLRVVRMDGSKPNSGSLFVRNLLRVVDVGLMFVGGVMIIMSPLRQRLGDLAGGTIVVRQRVVQAQDSREEEMAGSGRE